MKLHEALSALYARVPLGMRLGLDPMRTACARAGHPERAFEAIHVGGTNGKGSTCAMVESVLRASGKRTGLYTSPHLIRFAERVRVAGEPIDDARLVRVLEEALTIGGDLSFFETATLAAFLAFRQAKVDVAVIEVGIGGRLDATNVLEHPLMTAITGVALDHQDKLGDTLDRIAQEKAAIAKHGVTMVLGPDIPREAREAAVEVVTTAGGAILDALPLPSDVTLGLEGAHQRKNASVAWTIASELGIREESRRRGLAEARWPGRMERIRARGGEWLLDGAHNPDGARALVASLKGEPVGAVIFGALKDKAWEEMVDIVATIDAPRVYVGPQGRAPASPAELAERAPGVEASSVEEALAVAMRLASHRRGVVVVCGSLYLIGEARAHLLSLRTDAIVAL